MLVGFQGINFGAARVLAVAVEVAVAVAVAVEVAVAVAVDVVVVVEVVSMGYLARSRANQLILQQFSDRLCASVHHSCAYFFANTFLATAYPLTFLANARH